MQEKPEIVNNKEEIPWEHYKAQFEKIDPEETASRCHVEYDPSAGGFAIRLMGVEYRVSWPEFEIPDGRLLCPFRRQVCHLPGCTVGRALLQAFPGTLPDAPRILLWNQNRSLPRVNGAARRESPDHRRRRL